MMTLLREEGGIGLHNFHSVESTAMVEWTYKIWMGEELWAKWMRDCYTKDATKGGSERERRSNTLCQPTS